MGRGQGSRDAAGARAVRGVGGETAAGGHRRGAATNTGERQGNPDGGGSCDGQGGLQEHERGRGHRMICRSWFKHSTSLDPPGSSPEAHGPWNTACLVLTVMLRRRPVSSYF